MGSLGSLRCAQTLVENVNALYEETIDRLESTLQACCADFKPDTLGKVCACHRRDMLHPHMCPPLWHRMQTWKRLSTAGCSVITIGAWRSCSRPLSCRQTPAAEHGHPLNCQQKGPLARSNA